MRGAVTVTLVITSRPRVSIVLAERIVVTEAQIEYFLSSRRKSTNRRYQIFQALLCFGIFPVKMEKGQYNHNVQLSRFINKYRWNEVEESMCQ